MERNLCRPFDKLISLTREAAVSSGRSDLVSSCLTKDDNVEASVPAMSDAAAEPVSSAFAKAVPRTVMTSKTTKASLSRTLQLAGGGGGHPACLEGAIIMESSFAI